MIRALAVSLIPFTVPIAVAAFEITLPPGARQLSEVGSAFESYVLPLGPYAEGNIPSRPIRGDYRRRTWQVESTATVLQLIDSIRAELEQKGFRIAFECADTDCGGFDFRFATDIAPAPDMFVDLRDFHHLSALKGNSEAVSVLVSRAASNAYLQIIRVVSSGREPVAPQAQADEVPPVTTGTDQPDLIARLTAHGHVVLDDLEFKSGSSRLTNGEHASLRQIAAFMADNPKARIALVGHTDSKGALDSNIRLSKQRAQSARDLLVSVHRADGGRIAAEGMGYLAPVASNLTQDGREANRRVEAVLLSN